MQVIFWFLVRRVDHKLLNYQQALWVVCIPEFFSAFADSWLSSTQRIVETVTATKL